MADSRFDKGSKIYRASVRFLNDRLSKQSYRNSSADSFNGGGGACSKYEVDLTGAKYGDCKCGYPKRDHIVPKKNVTTSTLKSIHENELHKGGGKQYEQPTKPKPPPPKTTPPSLQKQAKGIARASVRMFNNIASTTKTTIGNNNNNNNKYKGCDQYELDLTGAKYGDCKCGYGRNDHTPQALQKAKAAAPVRAAPPQLAQAQPGASISRESTKPSFGGNENFSTSNRSLQAAPPVPQFKKQTNNQTISYKPPRPAYDSSNEDLEKYEKMKKAGLPQGAIEQAMIRDGVDPSLMNFDEEGEENDYIAPMQPKRAPPGSAAAFAAPPPNFSAAAPPSGFDASFSSSEPPSYGGPGFGNSGPSFAASSSSSSFGGPPPSFGGPSFSSNNNNPPPPSFAPFGGNSTFGKSIPSSNFGAPPKFSDLSTSTQTLNSSNGFGESSNPMYSNQNNASSNTLLIEKKKKRRTFFQSIRITSIFRRSTRPSMSQAGTSQAAPSSRFDPLMSNNNNFGGGYSSSTMNSSFGGFNNENNNQYGGYSSNTMNSNYNNGFSSNTMNSNSGFSSNTMNNSKPPVTKPPKKQAKKPSGGGGGGGPAFLSDIAGAGGGPSAFGLKKTVTNDRSKPNLTLK